MRDIVVGTAGHVDHGKTMLVKALTGIDADRLPEEKERGITLDIGFASFEAGGCRLHLVDLPGHERFIKNMLAGATGMDMCLLVVAADESVMPQTVEHAEIIGLLGIGHGLGVLTKVDAVDAETLDIAHLEFEEFLRSNGMGNFPIHRVSAVSGEGIEELSDAIVARAKACPTRHSDRPFRMPVDRVFTVKGFGTVVTGTCIDGELKEGDRIRLYPGLMESKVRGLQVFGNPVDRVVAGQRAALNIPDIGHQLIARGMLACPPGCSFESRLLDVKVKVLRSARAPLKTGMTCILHIHTQELEAHLHLSSGQSLEPGGEEIAQLRTTRPVIAWPGDRFILRLPSPARTVAGGEVSMVASRKARWGRPREKKIRLLLASGARGDATEAMLLEAGPPGIAVESLAARLGLAPDRVGEALAGLAGKRVATEPMAGKWWLHADEASAWMERITAQIRSKFSEKAPRAWIPRQEVAGKWSRIVGPERAAALVGALEISGKLEANGDKIRLRGHRATLSGEQAMMAQSVLGLMEAASPVPMSGGEIEEGAGAGARDVLRFLQEHGEIKRFSGDFFILPSSLEAIRCRLASLAGQGENIISIPRFKELFGLTRKHAMPLLELLDELKYTKRVPDGREILPGAAR